MKLRTLFWNAANCTVTTVKFICLLVFGLLAVCLILVLVLAGPAELFGGLELFGAVADLTGSLLGAKSDDGGSGQGHNC